MGTKQFPKTARVERAGVAVCMAAVNDMGHIFRERPTSDVGIDGDIEIVNQGTEAATGRILLVQIKSRSNVERDASGFLRFRCSEADIEYWLNAGPPVLLVIVDAPEKKAWFKNLNEWFGNDINRRRSRTVLFDPSADVFDKAASDRLTGWGVEASGLYMAPAPKPETLYANLLAVEHISESVYTAPTKVRRWKDVNERLLAVGHDPVSDVTWRDGLLWSFRPLDQGPLSCLVDGPQDRLGTDELEQSASEDDQRLLVRLLGGTLREIHHADLREDNRHEYLYFRATDDLSARRVSSGQRAGKGRTVFGPHYDKGTNQRVVYYRHLAVERQFMLLDDGWYLALNPTYHYTRDGRNVSRYAADNLQGIKRLERNEAVGRAVRFWADYLRGDDGLFSEPDHRLRFGLLANVDVDHGIDDQSWAPTGAESDDNASAGQLDFDAAATS